MAFNVRLEEKRSGILVIMGSQRVDEGACWPSADGYSSGEEGFLARNSLDLQNAAEGWAQYGRRRRALGWGWRFVSLPGVWRTTLLGAQDANVLHKMPKSVQGKAKGMLHEMWQAPTKDRCWRPMGIL